MLPLNWFGTIKDIPMLSLAVAVSVNAFKVLSNKASDIVAALAKLGSLAAETES